MISLMPGKEPLRTLAEHTHRFVKSKQKSLKNDRESPGTDVIYDVLSVLFYSSLKTEEGQAIQAHVIFQPPHGEDVGVEDGHPIERWRFFNIERIPLTVSNLVKFARAADPWSTAIAICSDDQGLFIWGVLDQLVHFNMGLVHEGSNGYLLPGAFHVSVTGPADLTVMQSQDFVARLAQDVVLTSENNCLWAGPVYERLMAWVNPLSALIRDDCRPFGETGEWVAFLQDHWVYSLSRVLLNIKRQRHGGAILITPDKSLPDMKIKYPLKYPRVADGVIEVARRNVLFYIARARAEKVHGHSDAAAVVKRLDSARTASEKSEQMLTGAVRTLSSLANVDGAVVLDTSLSVVGFGAILQAQQALDAFYVSAAETAESLKKLDEARFGTRHGSMMKYCDAHPECVGIVLSQDGDVRIFMKVDQKMVMFDNVALRSFDNFHIGPEILPEEIDTFD